LAFSYWTDKPWFLTKGKLAAVLVTPSLGVPNWSVIYIINTAPPSTHSSKTKSRQVKITTIKELFFCVFDKMMQAKIK
jgi:hypothetical protein